MMGNEFVEIMSVLFVVYSFFLNVDPNLLYLISAYIILFSVIKSPIHNCNNVKNHKSFYRDNEMYKPQFSYRNVFRTVCLFFMIIYNVLIFCSGLYIYNFTRSFSDVHLSLLILKNIRNPH